MNFEKRRQTLLIDPPFSRGENVLNVTRALAIRPEVLLYDEPTTGLDPINVTRIADLIEYLNGTLDVTSVVVTHDMDTALAISDRTNTACESI